jgi:uncharacterized protein (TIGR00730 family)
MRRVCVFCGSNRGKDPAYEAAAHAMGIALVRRGLELVYGGGKVGLMGVIAEAVMGAGGRATGIMPDNLFRKEIGHTELTDLRIVGSMHERKAMMAELSDAFIALPGGFGTFEEFCEAVTWTQLGLHAKPCGLLNVGGYYDPLIALFDRAESDGFLMIEHRELVHCATDPDELLDHLERHPPSHTDKWIEGIEET